MIDKNPIDILIGHKNNQFYHPLIILDNHGKQYQKISALYDPIAHHFTLVHNNISNTVHNIQEFRAFIHQHIPNTEYNIRIEHLYDDLIFDNIHTKFSHDPSQKIHIERTIFPQKIKHRSLIPAPFTLNTPHITNHTPFADIFDHAAHTLRAHYKWIKKYPNIQVSDDDLLSTIHINNNPDFIIRLHVHYTPYIPKLDISINKENHLLHRNNLGIAIPMDIDAQIHPHILQWCNTAPNEYLQDPCATSSISQHEHLHIARTLQKHLPQCVADIMQQLTIMNNILTQHTTIHA